MGMENHDIINNRYSEPAAMLSFRDGEIRVLEINKGFLPEMWMNVPEKEFLEADIHRSFDDHNLKTFEKAVRKCAETGEAQEVETWRKTFSDCCGFDSVCLRSRLLPVEETPEGVVIYEGIRNITNEKRASETLEDIEYRYKQASEQINIYNWEYFVDTKEMRPCYRCMRDLGLPAVVENYPEPAIEMGIFPADYADMYRDMMRKIDEGAPELEADIPLSVCRVPYRVKYTTEFDEKGNPVRAFGSARITSPSIAKLAETPPVVGDVRTTKYGIPAESSSAAAPAVFAICIRAVIPSCILAPPLMVTITSGSFFLPAYSARAAIFSPTTVPMLPIKKALFMTASAIRISRI